jgi:hypothetical protein
MQSWVQALGGTAVLFAVAMRVGERRVVETLEAAGAVDPTSATKLPQGNFFQKWQFRRLLNVGAVGETMDQAQYLRLAEYIAYRRRRRKRALGVLGVIALLAIVLYFTSRVTA